jgi:hypothetical protein
MKRLAFAIYSVLFFLACANSGFAQSTINAATCSQSAVQAAVNSAADGDTVSIAAGTCTWTSGVTVPNNMGITITGNGTPNSSATTTGASSSCTTTTITVSGNFTAFTMNPEYGNSTSRLSCMAIAYGSGQAVFNKTQGTCTSSGCPNFRMDNITYNSWAGHTEAGISYGINAIGDMFGVIDHNTVNGSAGNYLEIEEANNASYLGVGQWGDNAWAQPENYGTANFIYFENNLLNDAGLTDNEGNTGTYSLEGGGRIVARYNTFNITDNYNVALAWHGTESNGRPRSVRAYEFYGNSWNCSGSWAQSNGCPSVVSPRGGTGMVWGNTFPSGYNFPVVLQMNTYRTQGNPSGVTWGPCDGSTGYDTNDGKTYYSGTIASVSGGVITVSGNPGWTTNQWFVNGAPYSVHDVTQSNGSEISANGSNTLAFNDSGGPGQYNPAAGDSIQILRATKCIDQAGGRGAGTLYSSSCNPAGTGGSCTIVAASEPASPTYVWLESGSASPSAVAASNTARVIANRDFYNENFAQSAQSSTSSPFNGSSGMGHGTYANMPSSCTTGVGYWATDQGNWNQSGSGGQGQLYLCTAANTWTLSYTPYTYPHPLTGTGGTGTTLPPPTGLEATAH